MRYSAAALLCLLSGAVAAGAACHQLSFTGEVANGSAFSKEIGMGLSFRMVASGEQSGWSFEIGKTGAEQDGADYVYWLTPPWRGRLTTALDTSYGALAQDVAKPRSIEFWFVANKADAKEAAFAASNLIFSSPTIPEDEAWSWLGAVRMGKGTLRVVSADAKAGTALATAASSDAAAYGEILRLAFEVELIVPSGFKPSPQLSRKAHPCLPANAWLKDRGRS